MASTGCINEPVYFSNILLPLGAPGPGSGIMTWDFDRYTNFAVPATGINNPDSTTYTEGGRFSFSVNGHVYEEFILIQDTFIMPNAGADVVLCDSVGFQLNGNNPNAGAKGVWTSVGTATVDEPFNAKSRVSGLVPGSNLFVWTIGNCCDEASDTVDVFINLSTASTDVIVACDSMQWIDGNWYYASNNTATDTFINAVGCDSVVHLDLTVNYTNFSTDVMTVCDSVQWIDGNWYYASNNTATDTFTNAAGCDSVVFLDLTVNYTTYGTDIITACDSFVWIDGNTYYASNFTATEIIPNTLGCDSVVTLNLTMNYTTYGTDVIHACDSYTWIDGNTYTASNNTAMHTITNVAGCDSVVTLNLEVDYTTFGTDVIVACDSYTWLDGNTYTSSNSSAQHIIPNAQGCDSIITLNLTINYSNTIIDQVNVCDSYTWPVNGETYTSNKNRTITFTNQAGCDSIRVLELTVRYSTTSTDSIRACDEYRWIDGITYTDNNTTATDTSTNTVGCQHVTTLNLQIDRVNTSILFDTVDSVFLAIDTNAGASYVWLRCEPSPRRFANTNSPIFEPRSEGTYAVEITRGACVKTSDCAPFVFNRVGLGESLDNGNTHLYPNPNGGNFWLDAGGQFATSVAIYNQTGQLIQVLEQIIGIQEINLNAPAGIYLVILQNEEGTSYRRLVIQ
jgi:hypothetical protein